MESERILFKALEKEDLPLRVEWLNNKIVRDTLFVQFPLSLKETEAWYERVLQDNSRRDLMLVEKETGKAIGFAGYVNIDWLNRKAEPFIAIGDTEAWGKRYGTEVVHYLLDYGFNELGFNRQYGFILDFNKGAVKMDLRAGFEEEGLLIDDVFVHGKFHNRIMVGVTRDKFNKRFDKV